MEKSSGIWDGDTGGISFSYLGIPEPVTKHQGCPTRLGWAAWILLQSKSCGTAAIQPHPWEQAVNQAWDAGRQRHVRTAVCWNAQTAQSLHTTPQSPKTVSLECLHDPQKKGRQQLYWCWDLQRGKNDVQSSNDFRRLSNYFLILYYTITMLH